MYPTRSVKQGSADVTRSPLRHSVQTGRNRPADRQEPFLPGSPLQRNGQHFPHLHGHDARDEAEGGWAVVCTEETEIYPTSDISPIVEGRLWDDDDIPVFARMNELVHLHGALTGVELTHTGHRDSCLYTRAAASMNGYFLSRRLNKRSNECGGCLENRARLLREVLEDTKESVGDTCVVAIRHTGDDPVGRDGAYDHRRGGLCRTPLCP
jgi:dimethylamine/trimethylamine dehydrogenase